MISMAIVKTTPAETNDTSQMCHFGKLNEVGWLGFSPKSGKRAS